jgi:hypothetical protein
MESKAMTQAQFPMMLDDKRAKYVTREIKYEQTIESLRQQLAQCEEGCRIKDEQIETLEQQLARVHECLNSVREACLFSEDDGSIGVTQEPHIPYQLFDDICKALAATADLENVILCHAEPAAWQFVDDEELNYTAYNKNPPTQEQVEYLKKWNRPEWEPLYRAWEPKP